MAAALHAAAGADAAAAAGEPHGASAAAAAGASIDDDELAELADDPELDAYLQVRVCTMNVQAHASVLAAPAQLQSGSCGAAAARGALHVFWNHKQQQRPLTVQRCMHSAVLLCHARSLQDALQLDGDAGSGGGGGADGADSDLDDLDDYINKLAS